MPSDPQTAQTEQTFLALVGHINDQFMPDLFEKLNDHSIEHAAALDAAVGQTQAVHSVLVTILATANQFGVDSAGALAQRIFDVTSAVRRAQATLESERKAVPAPPAAPPPAPPVPPYPTTADEVFAQMRTSTDPRQMMINVESVAIAERRKSIDAMTQRILDSYKKP